MGLVKTYELGKLKDATIFATMNKKNEFNWKLGEIRLNRNEI